MTVGQRCLRGRERWRYTQPVLHRGGQSYALTAWSLNRGRTVSIPVGRVGDQYCHVYE
jgi:hypothetical protein